MAISSSALAASTNSLSPSATADSAPTNATICICASAIAPNGTMSLSYALFGGAAEWARPAGGSRMILDRTVASKRASSSVRGNDVDAEHHVRLRQIPWRTEGRAVNLDRWLHHRRGEVRRKREWQSHRGRELRAKGTRTENVNRYAHALGGHRPNSVIRPRREIPHQLEDIFRKSVWVGNEGSTQRVRSDGIGSRRAAKSEVNPAWEQRLQRAELLGDHERRVIREHNAASADADRCRPRRDMRDDDGRCRAGDSWHVVMLREPIAVNAETLGVAGVVERVAKGCCDVAALRDGCQIEN